MLPYTRQSLHRLSVVSGTVRARKSCPFSDFHKLATAGAPPPFSLDELQQHSSDLSDGTTEGVIKIVNGTGLLRGLFFLFFSTDLQTSKMSSHESTGRTACTYGGCSLKNSVQIQTILVITSQNVLLVGSTGRRADGGDLRDFSAPLSAQWDSLLCRSPHASK
eukprot:RCo052029